MALSTPLFAETTPGPPDWADAGASIYLGKNPATPVADESVFVPAPLVDQSSAEATACAACPPKVVDHSVQQALHQVLTATSAGEDARRLAPPSSTSNESPRGESPVRGERSTSPLRPLVGSMPPIGSLYTVFSALAIVIGAFLVFVWVVRRGGRKSTAVLPADVVSVLGRVPLAARQVAELLRVGNKLVLVSLTPTGVKTLTEITDPAEVDRLVGLCHQFNPLSTTKAFEQVFRQLSRETAPSGFLGDESLPASISSATAAYRAQRGDATRA